METGKGNKSTAGNAKAATGKEEKTTGGSSKASSGTEERSMSGNPKASSGMEERSASGNSKDSSGMEGRSTSGNSKASSGSEERSTSGNSRALGGKEESSMNRNSGSPAAKEGQTGGDADLSEELRELAAKYDETDYRHWVLVIVADRLGKIEDVVHEFDPNSDILDSVVEFGRTTDWKADKKSIIRQAATTVGAAALQAVAAVIAQKMQNKEK